MTPTDQLFFSVTSTITGGLVTDLTTTFIACFAITLICIGIDWLNDAMTLVSRNRALDQARSYKRMADSMDDQVSKDYNNALYRSAIRKAAR